MNQDATSEDIAAADSLPVSSENSTELFQAEQLEENKRIRKMSKFIRIKDDLDVALKEKMEKMLEAPPSIHKADFKYSDIFDMVHGLLSAESLVVPDFSTGLPSYFGCSVGSIHGKQYNHGCRTRYPDPPKG